MPTPLPFPSNLHDPEHIKLGERLFERANEFPTPEARQPWLDSLTPLELLALGDVADARYGQSTAFPKEKRDELEYYVRLH